MLSPGRLPKALISGVCTAVLLISFGGCGSEQSPVGYLIEAVGGDPYALGEEGSRELARFNSVYGEYVSQSADGQFGHFSDAFKRVRVSYIHDIPDAKLIDASIKGVRELEADPQTALPGELVEAALDSMMASLDPHSAYLNPDELRETEVSNRGEFGGLGIEVTMEDGVIKIISPLEGTPALRAGLESGDRITHLDGTPLKGKTLLQAVKLMRGRPGTDIRLTVNRDGYPPFGVTITRFHYVSYGAGGLLLVTLAAMALLGPRPVGYAVRSALVACMLAVALYSGLVVLSRIDAIQQEVGGLASSLPADDARRLRFDELHLLSTRLMMLNLAGALVLLYWEARDK